MTKLEFFQKSFDEACGVSKLTSAHDWFPDYEQIFGKRDGKVFTWAWSENGIPKAKLAVANLARRWGQINGVEEFARPQLSANESDAKYFLAVAMKLSGANQLRQIKTATVETYLLNGLPLDFDPDKAVTQYSIDTPK